MWEGFKVEQIVLANTGMENAPSAAAGTIPKLAAHAAELVLVSISLPAKQIQITFWGYIHYGLTR